MKKKFRVLITGGGTGGHIYPMIAVVSELQLQAIQSGIDLKIRYLGAYGPYKNLLIENNIKVSKIISSKIRRYVSFSNIWEIPKFIFGFIQALWSVYWFMPDILFSKGGPGSLPVVLAARFYAIPIVIHESDSVPGLSNLLAGRYAKKVAISFEGVAKYFPGKAVLVGNPIREAMIKGVKFDRQQEKRRFGFNDSDPLMLVIGGSQGSVRINEFILKNLPLILQATQVLHQTGKENYEVVLSQVTDILAPLPEEVKAKYKAVPYFTDNMQDAYIASDVVVGRAGAGSIFEIAAFKRPSILIPLPESAQNHQKLNAYEYADKGAAIVIEESNLFPNLFLNTLIDIFSNPEKIKSMEEAAERFYKPGSALNLAKIILEYRK